MGLQIMQLFDKRLVEYQAAWDIQKNMLDQLLEKRKNYSVTSHSGFLILCEHPHVFTLGKSGSINNLLINETMLKEKGATFFKTDRGGDITYHGPGQIVGYPILDLNLLGLGVKEYVHRIEETIINTLDIFHIAAERLPGATGVWLDANTKKTRKICAIGVRVSRGITMHGFALNVNTDLSFFNYINPCGYTDKAVTSIAKELGSQQNIEEVKAQLKKKITQVFDMEF